MIVNHYTKSPFSPIAMIGNQLTNSSYLPMAMIGNQHIKSVITMSIMFLARVICFFLSVPLARDIVLLILRYMME